jgi:UDP-N-acetylmuramoyl-tripeptide--D-alanyl-D-alanine ligase
LKIETLYKIFLESAGICTDTRKIIPNCLFFALKGDNFNGNTFAQKSLDLGATKVIIDDISYHNNSGKTILCGDSLKLLQKLANYHRRQLGIPIIAITGSNGKTTTKELIHSVLSQKYNCISTFGNLNNHIGVPLTLLSMDARTELGIVEMGANHLKEIEDLCKIAEPDFGYITNFGKAHLLGFGSMEGVIKAKSELYRFLKEHEKLVFVNGNDSKQMEITKLLNRKTFGSEDQDFVIKLIDDAKEIIIEFNNMKIQTQLIGVYNFHNVATAIAIGAHFEVSDSSIKKAIEEYKPTNNRSQLMVIGDHKIILDAYNANPTSMMAALENFEQIQAENKVLYLGDMFELGSDSHKEHQLITNWLEEHAIGEVNLIGDHFYKTQTGASHIHKFQSFDAFKINFKKSNLGSSHILIKGSRGMALERILELL